MVTHFEGVLNNRIVDGTWRLGWPGKSTMRRWDGALAEQRSDYVRKSGVVGHRGRERGVVRP
jgi:hypothetical protein